MSGESPFSNPVSGAASNPDAYIQALLAMLGDDDPLEVQAGHVARIERAIRGVGTAELRRPEKPGKWSIAQVLNHLVDTELVYGYRIRMIVAHDAPRIPSYDQDLWAERLRSNDGDPRELVDELRALRGRNLRLIRSLSKQEWQRFGMHEERGKESVDRLVRMIAGHDRVHLRQIERIKTAHGLGNSVL
jgi:hypothetical protein